MGFAEAIALAIVQGLTEFLPISSSGHLILVGDFFGKMTVQMLGVIIVVHLATAAAAALFYRRDLAAIARSLLPGTAAADRGASLRLLALLAAATVPTAVIGLAFNDFFERLFGATSSVAPGLFLTGALLFASARADGAEEIADAPWWKAVVIGLVQGIAIVPGVSRSGSTIAAALLLGVRRADAVRFSFLLALPAILGATILEFPGIALLTRVNLPQCIIGFMVTAAVGYASIFVVLRGTRTGRLWYFAPYCWSLAAIAFLLGYG